MKALQYLSFLIITASLTLTTACKEKEDPDNSTSLTAIDIILKDAQGNTVRTGENINLSNGYEVNISLFRLYLSNIYLTSTANASIEVNDIALLNPSEVGANSFTVQVQNGTYNKIKFGLGLDAADNDKNPADFAQEHPLSTYQSMYWSMLKYRFAKFEGKANKAGQLGTSSDIAIAFHPGTDALYREVELPIDITASNGSKSSITLEINVDDLFIGSNPFDFENPAEFNSHSTTTDIQYAEKFMKNLKASIKHPLN